MKTKCVIAYQDEINDAYFLMGLTPQYKWTWTTSPQLAQTFDGFDSAKNMQNNVEITPMRYTLCILTYESIQDSSPHPIRKMLDEAAKV